MKLRVAIFFLSSAIMFVSCKSEEPKNEPKQTQNNQNMLPPKQEQANQQIVKQKNLDPKISEELIAVIKENIEATAAENKQRVLNTIHKDSPQMRSTIQGMDFVFTSFDMEFILEKIEVIEINGDDAKVYYVITRKAIRGEGFAPNRATGIHNMKKENGKWKIYKTEELSNEQIH